MIIPLAHENLRGRRWPWVTIAIIALNTLIFLFTHAAIEREMAQLSQVELHILLLSARYPDTRTPPEVGEMVEAYKLQHARTYKQMESPSRTGFVDPWDAKLLGKDWTQTDADSEMANLSSQLLQLRRDSISWNYAFHPLHPTLRSYVTATFLHGGWLHLIFNMWFLWLAGTVLEDVWGRVAYPIFYMSSGVLALLVQAAVFPHSFVPVVGASGAIAGLMGGFLARFPKTRIRFGWLFFFRLIKFYVPAYVVLPLWLVIQIFSGALVRSAGAEAGVAYWAHIGGFLFGMIGAVLLRASGIEHSLDQAIEAKVSWTADPRIVRAAEFLGENRANASIAELQQLVREQPESLQGWELLLRAQERLQDLSGQKETLAALCRLEAGAGEMQSAWNYYQQFTAVGGEKVPRGVWLELCRYLEREQHWDLAASEYERLAGKNPGERAAACALVSAAGIYLKQLHRPERAGPLYQAAAASPAPHSDLDAAIEEGLQQCAASVPQPGLYRA